MKIDSLYIVDDDPIFVYGVKKLLERFQYCDRIEVFVNGQEILDHLIVFENKKEKFPDLIFLDLNMPILDGWQFLEEFVKFPNAEDTIVYIASSSVDPQDTVRASTYAIVKDYIGKPISLTTIKGVMDSYFQAS